MREWLYLQELQVGLIDWSVCSLVGLCHEME